MHNKEVKDDVISRNLDLSGGEPPAEVTVDVPPEEGGGKTYAYSVKVSAENMRNSILNNEIKTFWNEIENAVREDINKV